MQESILNINLNTMEKYRENSVEAWAGRGSSGLSREPGATVGSARRGREGRAAGASGRRIGREGGESALDEFRNLRVADALGGGGVKLAFSVFDGGAHHDGDHAAAGALG